jgi:uncharacterized protein (UPF0216 family)
MEKVTLKLYEFYNLEAELNGLVNQQTGEKIATGLLAEKLSMVTKYWLSDLAKKVATEKESIEKLKEELIKKHGTEDDKGGISIPMSIDEVDADGNAVKTTDAEGNETVKKVINPEFVVFEKEFNELLQLERDVEYNTFKLVDFSAVETSQNYTTFFKLISVEEAKVVPM